MIIKSRLRRFFISQQSGLNAIIDTFADDDSILWPVEVWPRDRFESKLALNACGGHGGTRYSVAEYVPGHFLKFEFTFPKSYHGFHSFRLTQVKNQQWLLEHNTFIKTNVWKWFLWVMLISPVHNALIQDAFDKAEKYASTNLLFLSKWPLRVYFIRHLLGGSRLVASMFSTLNPYKERHNYEQ
jgi:hypothetical protein